MRAYGGRSEGGKQRFRRADVKLRLVRRGHLEPEDAAVADGAFHADDAPHQFDQLLGDHEANAGAFLSARLLAETVERWKELGEFFRRQTRAIVFDGDAHAFG